MAYHFSQRPGQIAALFLCLLLPQALPAAPFAYVGNYPNLISIDVATGTQEASIPVGTFPAPIAITPDGTMAYVCSYFTSSIVPITLATGYVNPQIDLGFQPNTIAITPDGTMAYVCDANDGTVQQINLATHTLGATLSVGTEPDAVAIAPDGNTAYVCNYGSGTVTQINLTTHASTTISVGNGPNAIAITPDGTKAYVCNAVSGTVTQINLVTHEPNITITVEVGLTAIAITPDGTMAYICSSGTVIPMTLASHEIGSAILVGWSDSIAITPDGATAYVYGFEHSMPWNSSVTSINLRTSAVSVVYTGQYPSAGPSTGIAITPDQAPFASFTTSINGSTVSFDGSSSSSPVGSIAKYDWDFGDGHTDSSTSSAVTHTYDSSGTFTVTLTVTNTSGTSTRQTFTGQTVSNNGGPSAVFSASVVVEEPLTVLTFTGKIKKNVRKEKLSIKTKWQASSSSKIRLYQIFAGRKKIKTISAHHPRKARIHLHPRLFPLTISEKYRTYLHNKYKIRALYHGGSYSPFVKLTFE